MTDRRDGFPPTPASSSTPLHDGVSEWDPSDPFDAMSETFRRQVMNIALNAENVALFKEMDSHMQLCALVAGIATGLLGVSLSYTDCDGREDLYQAIIKYMPQAKQQALDIFRDAENSVSPSYQRSSEGTRSGGQQTPTQNEGE